MYELRYDPRICQACPTVDCLVRCQYMDLDLAAARAEKDKLLAGEMNRVLTDCVTCYGCEEYCPSGNHPFYQIVERQEALGVLPAPVPITRQQHAAPVVGEHAQFQQQTDQKKQAAVGAVGQSAQGEAELPSHQGAVLALYRPGQQQSGDQGRDDAGYSERDLGDQIGAVGEQQRQQGVRHALGQPLDQTGARR